MADNVTANAGSGGATFATDQAAGGEHHPYVKIEFGADNTQTKVSTTDPLPVTLQYTGANTTAIKVDGSAVTQPVSIAAAVAVTDNSSSLTVDNAALSVTGGGVEASALRVTIASDSTGVLSVDDNGSTLSVDDGGGTLTVDGTVAATQSGTWTVQPGNTANTTAWLVTGTGGTFPVTDSGGSLTVDNGGTFAVQVDGSALTALQKIDDPVLVDDAAFTPAMSSVMMAGFEADETSTDSIDEGDAGAARMTLDRKVIVNPQPHTQGGLSIFRSIDLDETAEEVKASAGQIYGMWVTNTATATRFLKFYNATAANVTVGTTTPVITWGIPGNSSDDISAVFGMGMGIAFDTAITVAATTGVADNDTGAPGANEIIVNIFFK